jgi:hypothetical protein
LGTTRSACRRVCAERNRVKRMEPCQIAEIIDIIR